MAHVAWSKLFSFSPALQLPQQMAATGQQALAVGQGDLFDHLPTMLPDADVVESHMSGARAALNGERWNQAADHYAEALDAFGRPTAWQSTPLTQSLLESPEHWETHHRYLRNLLFENASYAQPFKQHEMYDDLRMMEMQIASRCEALEKLREEVSGDQLVRAIDSMADCDARLAELDRILQDNEAEVLAIHAERGDRMQQLAEVRTLTRDYDGRIEELEEAADQQLELAEEYEGQRIELLGWRWGGEQRSIRKAEIADRKRLRDAARAQLKVHEDAIEGLNVERSPHRDKRDELKAELKQSEGGLADLMAARFAHQTEYDALTTYYKGQDATAEPRDWREHLERRYDTELAEYYRAKFAVVSTTLRSVVKGRARVAGQSQIGGRGIRKDVAEALSSLQADVLAIQEEMALSGRDMVGEGLHWREGKEPLRKPHLYGQLLAIELVARRAEFAHRCKNIPLLKKMLKQFSERMTTLVSEYGWPPKNLPAELRDDETMKEHAHTVAEVLADAADVFERMGLRDDALLVFHRLGTSDIMMETSAFQKMTEKTPYREYLRQLSEEQQHVRVNDPRDGGHHRAANSDFRVNDKRAAAHIEHVEAKLALLKRKEFARSKNLGKRLKGLAAASISNAHYGIHRVAEPIIVGGGAMAAAAAADYYLNSYTLSAGSMGADPSLDLWKPVAAAVLATTGVRLLHGARSPEAKSAWKTGHFKRPDGYFKYEALGTLGRMGALAGVSLVPAYALVSVPERMDEIQRVNSAIWAMWTEKLPQLLASAFGVEYREIADLGRLTTQMGPDQTALMGSAMFAGATGPFDRMGKTLKEWRESAEGIAWLKRHPHLASVINHPYRAGYIGAAAGIGTLFGIDYLADTDWVRTAYNAYLYSTAGIYGAYTFFPSLRQPLKKIAPHFIPGAILLSAHLGLHISEELEVSWDHLKRLTLGSLALVEGMVMLFASGTVPLPFSKKSPPVHSSEFWKTLGHGITHNMNPMALVALAITIGVSSALGKLFIGSFEKKSLDLALIYGTMITFGLLPMTLLMSGVAKQQIPAIPNFVESIKKNHPLRIDEHLRSAAYAFSSPYTANRVLRSVSWDLPSASLRAMIGWDSIPGLLAGMGVNIWLGNTGSTMMWPEMAGTPWQHDAFVDAVFAGGRLNRAKLIDHLRKMSGRVNPGHAYLATGNAMGDTMQQLGDWNGARQQNKDVSLAQRAENPLPPAARAHGYMAAPVQRVKRPPDFPLQRQHHYLSEFYFYVTGQTGRMKKDGTHTKDRLKPEHLKELLAELKDLAQHPEYTDIVRPAIQLLYLARPPEDVTADAYADFADAATGGAAHDVRGDEVPAHRNIIGAWFKNNPGLVDDMFLERRALIQEEGAMKSWVRRNFDEDGFIGRLVLEPAKSGVPIDETNPRRIRVIARRRIRESFAAYAQRFDAHLAAGRMDLTTGKLQ